MAADLFDLLADLEPDAARQSALAAAYGIGRPGWSGAPSDKPEPTARNHLCQEPGCPKWGSFGIYTADISRSQWWCADHLPDWWESGAPP